MVSYRKLPWAKCPRLTKQYHVNLWCPVWSPSMWDSKVGAVCGVQRTRGARAASPRLSPFQEAVANTAQSVHLASPLRTCRSVLQRMSCALLEASSWRLSLIGISEQNAVLGPCQRRLTVSFPRRQLSDNCRILFWTTLQPGLIKFVTI